ncbi:methyltransferase domain-containing protein [Cereibacter sphaeroides]|uniref:class I SAM-dependent methyltransferase n=1 Tax=Cereibacter sphaeroides TaxID=1063 RepID=UPI001F3CA971|nr:methyltransferase domain-containing protein [Cereibacter sphaeroides]MCE6949491.1 methyltransferase domain-containing protein [Cereibacter sphaeroides]
MDTVTKAGPAEVYERAFVPALFAQWGPVLAELAAVAPGKRVLDVGCGTGAATIAAASRAAPGGRVIGLDPNPEMLAVARRKPGIEWVEGRAEALPFPDATQDAVISQFAMMFFENRVAALKEMARVLSPGGRMAVAVCGALTASQGYHALVGLLDRLFGRDIGDAFRSPFVLGNAAALEALADEAELKDATVAERVGTVRFGSIADLVATERACAWTLGGLLDDDQFACLRDAAERELAPFKTENGIAFDMPALILTARV